MHSKWTGRDIATILTVSSIISGATVAGDRILERIRTQDAKIHQLEKRLAEKEAEFKNQAFVCMRELEEIDVLRKQVHSIVDKINRG